MTFGISFHGYEGFHIEGDLFWKYAVLGFITFGICIGTLETKLRAIVEKVRGE